MKIHYLILFVFSALLGGQSPAASDVQTLTYPGSPKPGELSCEANYHLWLPPGVKVVRGVIVHQHGCGDGAERGSLAAAEDLHWRKSTAARCWAPPTARVITTAPPGRIRAEDRTPPF